MPERLLYHFTSGSALREILQSGFLMPSCSNLLPPRIECLHIVERRVVDNTTDYKPVIWFTSDFNSSLKDLGLDGAEFKQDVFLAFPFSNRFKSWKTFADENKVECSWRKKLEKGRKPDSWYIHEGPICIWGEKIGIYARLNKVYLPLKEALEKGLNLG